MLMLPVLISVYQDHTLLLILSKSHFKKEATKNKMHCKMQNKYMRGIYQAKQ